MVKEHIKQEVKEQPNNTTDRLTKNQKKRLKQKQRQYIRSLKQEAQGTSSHTVMTGLQAFINHNEQDQDINISNVIATGMKRKLKKKLKKLQRQQLPDQQIFKGLQKARAKIHKSNDRVVFNPKSQLVDRRKKRMERLKANRQKRKKEILQKMD